MDLSRFSVISDEVSQNPAVVARFVRDFDLPGFELRSMFGRAFKDLSARDVAEIRTLAEGEGWGIHGCSTPVFKCELEDAGAIREHREIFRRSLDVARELRCDLVRVFTFLRRPEALSRETVDRIAAHLTPLAEAAAAAGMRLGIENESSCRIGSGAELLRLGEALVHPAAGWIWDPCNVLYVPGETGPATAGFAALVPRIIHLHVKDASRTPGAATLAASRPLGEGEEWDGSSTFPKSGIPATVGSYRWKPIGENRPWTTNHCIFPPAPPVPPGARRRAGSASRGCSPCGPRPDEP